MASFPFSLVSFHVQQTSWVWPTGLGRRDALDSRISAALFFEFRWPEAGFHCRDSPRVFLRIVLHHSGTFLTANVDRHLGGRRRSKHFRHVSLEEIGFRLCPTQDLHRNGWAAAAQHFTRDGAVFLPRIRLNA